MLKKLDRELSWMNNHTSVTRERQELANERIGWQGRDVRATEPNDLYQNQIE